MDVQVEQDDSRGAHEGSQGRPKIVGTKFNLRATVGLAASLIVCVVAFTRFDQNFVCSLLLGGGWGLAMLYGVQLRGLLRRDGSVSWTGALSASLAWSACVGALLLGWHSLLDLLDITTLLTLCIYLAAKLGCHRIGCCNWAERMHYIGISLPILEVLMTAAVMAIGIWAWRFTPAGMLAAALLSIHILSWSLLKLYREPEGRRSS